MATASPIGPRQAVRPAETCGVPPPGARLPPAPPGSEAVRDRFRRQRRRDTAPEMALRRLLHARGLRYRVDVAPLPMLRRWADLVFISARLVVFVDGCFWHRCPDHGTAPRNNGEWWRAKLDRNVQRDRDTDRALVDAGWQVVRVWEHEDPALAADRVQAAWSARRAP